MKRRECASLIILALAAVPALLVAIGQVYVTGVDGIRLRRTETIDLLTDNRRLAAAVGTEQGNEFTTIDLQRHAIGQPYAPHRRTPRRAAR